MAGPTLDTGALIALSRRRQRAREIVNLAFIDDVTVTVPSAVVAEWWRERSDEATTLLKSVTVEALNTKLACIAGEAMAAVRGSTVVDAIVMASAAQ